MMWLAIGVLAGFAVKVPMAPFHTWLPAAYAEAPSPVTMLLTGAMSKMGVYGLLRSRCRSSAPDRADTDATPDPCRSHGGDGCMGCRGAERSEARALPIRRSTIWDIACWAFSPSRFRPAELRGDEPGRRAERRNSANVQPRPYGGGAVLVCGDDSIPQRRASRYR